jgi:hypothetical protein
MVNFPRWIDFLSTQAHRLRSDGFHATLSTDQTPGRGKANLDISNDKVLATFTCWESGLVDFDIMDAKSQTFVANVWGQKADDATLDPIFHNFLESLSTFRS